MRVSVGVKTWEKAPRPSLAETCVHCICVVWHVVRQSVHACGVVWCVMCGMAVVCVCGMGWCVCVCVSRCSTSNCLQRLVMRLLSSAEMPLTPDLSARSDDGGASYICDRPSYQQGGANPCP